MANISFTDRPIRHIDATSQANHFEFQTEVDCGFNLPSAYKSHNRQLDHLVAIATLVASVGVMAILAFVMFWRGI